MNVRGNNKNNNCGIYTCGEIKETIRRVMKTIRRQHKAERQYELRKAKHRSQVTGRGHTRATAERPSVVQTDPVERGHARTEGKWMKQQLRNGETTRNIRKTHKDEQIMIPR